MMTQLDLSQTRFEKDNLFKIWTFVFAAIPVWWVCGLTFGIYHFTALLLILVVIHQAHQEHRGILIPFSFFLVAFLVVAYLFSLAIHFSTSDPLRVFASFYNLSLWAMGCLLILALTNLFSVSHLKAFLKKAELLAVLICILTWVMLVFRISGFHTVTLKTPLYGMTDYLGHTILVENSFLIQPIYADWVRSSYQARLNIFSPYPTAAGGLMVMMLFFLFARGEMGKRMKSLPFLFLIFSNLLALYFTLSRMAIIAFLMGVGMIWLLEKKHFFFWLSLALIAFIFLLPVMERGVNWLLLAREESTLGRLELYRYSLSQLQASDWFVGLGVKPRQQHAFSMPIGSHSTYISLLFKTGLMGLLPFLALQIYLFFQWYGLKARAQSSEELYPFWKALGGIFFSLGIWMVTQDLDAPQLVCFLYFSCIGIFEAFRRQLSG